MLHQVWYSSYSDHGTIRSAYNSPLSLTAYQVKQPCVVVTVKFDFIPEAGTAGSRTLGTFRAYCCLGLQIPTRTRIKITTIFISAPCVSSKFSASKRSLTSFFCARANKITGCGRVVGVVERAWLYGGTKQQSVYSPITF